MADSRLRMPLQSSYSFSGSSTSDAVSRPLKRRLTTSGTDPAYFTPSSNNFRPRPYQPQDTYSSCATTAPPQPRSNPSTRSHALGFNPVPSMDPSLLDPGAVFIHPPFTEFPDAHKYKDGLTYNLMAANPEWFLDPADFISTVNDNPHAIRYPSQLEPPRGWCPAKKKDVKDGWPEGEEPRLRCTFCRRTYAGVNAKSMWRRHVYEKHKIAMSNRRDNAERKGGRGSNKENKEDKETGRISSRSSRPASDNIESESAKLRQARRDSADWKNSLGYSMDRSRFSQGMDEDEGRAAQYDRHPLPDELSGPEGEVDVFRVAKSSSTPPLTPGFSPTKSSQSRRLPSGNNVPESPYDPLSTPSFRHSPPRIASEQPWRFPSPSHPLYSSARELSLSMLMRGEASPVVGGLDVSPVVIVPAGERGKRSIFSSPISAKGKKKTHTDLESAEKPRIFPSPSPHRLFYDGPLPIPFTDRAEFKKYRIPESPLGRVTSSAKTSSSLASLVEANNTWLSDASLSPPAKTDSDAPGLLDPIQLEGEDPFVESLYSSWVDLNGKAGESSCGVTPAKLVQESPVFRSNQASRATFGEGGKTNVFGLSGLGKGLMDAFLSGKGKDRGNFSSDDDLIMISREDNEEAEIGRSLGSSPVPTGKKTGRGFLTDWLRDDNHDTEMRDALPPKKRRKTISGHD
ncbi:hypothetical protein AcW1_000811 [Taiwanofungus camphoratus]|nr:hypothetical protein AcW1_000811 [Antrodia cinnamomea]